MLNLDSREGRMLGSIKLKLHQMAFHFYGACLRTATLNFMAIRASNFIKDHVKDAKGSRISYGIPIGGELEYVDGTTIARAIEGRVEINVD